MRIQLLRPVKFANRKPIRNGRYFLTLISGLNVTKRFFSKTRRFGSSFPQELVETWHEPISIPSAEDMQYLVSEHIPSHIRYEERQAMLKGVALAIECLERYLQKS